MVVFFWEDRFSFGAPMTIHKRLTQPFGTNLHIVRADPLLFPGGLGGLSVLVHSWGAVQGSPLPLRAILFALRPRKLSRTRSPPSSTSRRAVFDCGERICALKIINVG